MRWLRATTRCKSLYDPFPYENAPTVVHSEHTPLNNDLCILHLINRLMGQAYSLRYTPVNTEAKYWQCFPFVCRKESNTETAEGGGGVVFTTCAKTLG